VSAGQITRGPKKSSRKTWIALTAIALVGGGIAAAAVLAGGGSSGGVAAKDPGGAGSAVAPGSAAAPKDKADVWSAAAGSGSSSDDDDNGDDGDSAAAADKHADDPMADQLEKLDDMIKALPPEQQKRLAGYRGLSKLPPKERLKRLRALAAQGMAGLEAPDPAAIARDATGGTAEQPPPPPPPPGAWISNETIDPPPGFDPEHLDVTAFIPWAIDRARKAIPDAQLIRIDTNGVSPDGRANLKLASHASEHGSIDVRFISPSRGKRDPKQPLGVARHDFKCEFRIMATPEGVEMMPIDFADCSKERVVPVPRCSFSAVWKKAIARKAPAQHVVGNVDYRSNGSKPVWYFDIGSGFDVAFSQMFSDDC
jgi:hypothetical protein